MLKGLILIGGKSARMGRDKHLLDHHGQPQYLHLLELLSEMNIPTFLSCRKDQAESLTDQSLIVDHYDSYGPMGGVATAFEEDERSSWLVFACDMPNISERSIRNLIEADDPLQDIVCYQKEGAGFFETAFAIYHPSVYSELKRSIDQKELSLQTLFNRTKVKSILPDDPDVLHNVNTPHDLR